MAIAIAIATILLLLSPGFATPAGADDVECGDVITESITLTHDVGPCEGDGLIVRGDDVTVDLGGHRVFATPETNGPEENVGIRLGRVSGVTVQNGTVEGFDAGVFIAFGGDNTVQRITARNNINDMEEPWRFASGQPPTEQPDVQEGDVSPEQWSSEMLCFFGDGITTESSSNNVIRHNTVVGNGPYGGITLVGDSDGNQVEKNLVDANNINNWTTRADGEEGTGLCGATLPGAPGMQRGREVQSIGIRLEGPGADNNVLVSNEVTDNALVGIAIHSYVCQPLPGEPRPGAPNEQNLINNNRVSSTGDERRFVDGEFVSVERDAFADGISSMAQGPIGTVTCTSHDNTITDNTSMDNDRHGVSLHRTVETTEASGNVANRNGGSGVWVADEAVSNVLHHNRGHHNAEADGFDGNDDCDDNDWLRNRFKTVNQACVAGGGGTGWVGGPGNSGQAGAGSESTGAPHRGRPDA